MYLFSCKPAILHVYDVGKLRNKGNAFEVTVRGRSKGQGGEQHEAKGERQQPTSRNWQLVIDGLESCDLVLFLHHG